MKWNVVLVFRVRFVPQTSFWVNASLKLIITVMVVPELIVIQEEGEVIEHQLSALPIAFEEVILILKTKKWLITIHSDNHLMQQKTLSTGKN